MVLVDGARQGKGTGPSKKKAEAAAALDALERMGYTSDGGIVSPRNGVGERHVPEVAHLEGL